MCLDELTLTRAVARQATVVHAEHEYQAELPAHHSQAAATQILRQGFHHMVNEIKSLQNFNADSLRELTSCFPRGLVIANHLYPISRR